jgi:hypothetical protein
MMPASKRDIRSALTMRAGRSTRALAVILASATTFGAGAQCVGNLNNDGAIDGVDLGALLGAWGPCVGECPSDLNADGNVDGIDLGLLLSGWGTCPGAPAWATVLEWSPDPQVVTDAALRQSIVVTGRPWRVLDTGTGIELLLGPPSDSWTPLTGRIAPARRSVFHVHDASVYA